MVRSSSLSHHAFSLSMLDPAEESSAYHPCLAWPSSLRIRGWVPIVYMAIWPRGLPGWSLLWTAYTPIHKQPGRIAICVDQDGGQGWAHDLGVA